jgi:hypothetical protein
MLPMNAESGSFAAANPHDIARLADNMPKRPRRWRMASASRVLVVAYHAMTIRAEATCDGALRRHQGVGLAVPIAPCWKCACPCRDSPQALLAGNGGCKTRRIAGGTLHGPDAP